MVRLLLDHGADPSQKPRDAQSWAVIMEGEKFRPIAQALAEYGADVTGWEYDLSSPSARPAPPLVETAQAQADAAPEAEGANGQTEATDTHEQPDEA
jgi:hypothetical protein